MVVVGDGVVDTDMVIWVEVPVVVSQSFTPCPIVLHRSYKLDWHQFREALLRDCYLISCWCLDLQDNPPSLWGKRVDEQNLKVLSFVV